MNRPVFYAPLLDDDPLVLDGAEGHHAADVRRLRVGEAVRLTDGAGSLADATVTEVGPGRCVCRVHDRWSVAPPECRLCVALAVLKGERMMRAVEQLTEAGADRIVPWLAERSVPAADGHHLARWRAAATSAAKQSGRARFPEIPDVQRLAAVASSARSALAVVADADGDAEFASLRLSGCREVLLVVGPEGGLTDAERAELAAAGARGARFGGQVLRSGTAALAGTVLVNVATGRWGRLSSRG